MPNYAEPFGLAGGVAGGAAGAGAGGLLGQLLGPLDMPRRALWGMPGRLAQGDVLGALPGLAGLAAGGATALVPGGLPFAGMVGSAVGGLGEGVEEALRPNMQQAPEPSDLVRQLGGDPESFGGKAAGMALGMAGDPLSYAGGLGGASKGAELGEQGGRYLEQAALARGPQYPGGAAKLAEGLDQARQMSRYAEDRRAMLGLPQKGTPFERVLSSMLMGPHAEQLAAEFPPGAFPLGEGAEGKVWGLPDKSGVIRVGGGPPEAGQVNVGRIARGEPLTATGAPLPRVDDPAMLQPVRDRMIGPWRVEHLPFVNMLSESAAESAPGAVHGSQAALAGMIDRAEPALTADVASRGLQTTDMHPGNMGQLLHGPGAGNIAITDPSNIFHAPGIPPERIPEAGGGWFTNKLLDLLGADKSVQGEIGQGLAQGGGTAGLSPEQILAHHQAEHDAMPATNRLVGAAPARPPDWDPFAGPRNDAGELILDSPRAANPNQASEAMRQLGLRPNLPPLPSGQWGDLAQEAAGHEAELQRLIAARDPRANAVARQFMDARDRINAGELGPFRGADLLDLARQHRDAAGGVASPLMDALQGSPAAMTQMPTSWPFTGGPHGPESPDVLPLTPPGGVRPMPGGDLDLGSPQQPGSGIGSLLAELGGGGQPGFTPQQFNAEGGFRGADPGLPAGMNTEEAVRQLGLGSAELRDLASMPPDQRHGLLRDLLEGRSSPGGQPPMR